MQSRGTQPGVSCGTHHGTTTADTAPPTTTYSLTERGHEATALLAEFEGMLMDADCDDAACATTSAWQPCVTVSPSED